MTVVAPRTALAVGACPHAGAGGSINEDSVEPQAIGRVLAGVVSPTAAADRLVELAVLTGSPDDVTALVVDPRRSTSRPEGAACQS